MANWANVMVTIFGDEETVTQAYEHILDTHKRTCPGDGTENDDCLLFLMEGAGCSGEHERKGNAATFFFDARWNAPWEHIEGLSRLFPSLLFHTFQAEVNMGLLGGVYAIAGEDLLVREHAELDADGHHWVLCESTLTCDGMSEDEMEHEPEEGSGFSDWEDCFWEMRWRLSEQLWFDPEVGEGLLAEVKSPV